MSASDFNYEVEALQQRASELQKSVIEGSIQSPRILPETFEELQIALEELRVAAEELQGQNEELVATRRTVEMERQRYQDLFDFAPDSYLVTDPAGTIREANCAAAMLLRVSQKNLIGKPLINFVTKGDRKTFRILLTQLTQLERMQDWEVCLQPRGGVSFHAAITVAAVNNLQGKRVDLRWLIRDITERKRVEIEIHNTLIKEKELSDLKSRFISMTSHEFRNPLSVILASAQLLKDHKRKFSEEKQLEHLHRIQEAGKIMTHLLSNVLLIGRAEAGKLQVNLAPLNLAKFCCDLVEEMQLSVGIKHTLALTEKGDCTNTCVDENLLRHILTNLLSNAIKYSPQSSTVNFELSCQDGEAIFQIKDEGIGIASADQQRLFEPFHRGGNVGDIPGTGLGLTVVKKYVDLHGGKITVGNNVGVGTTFTVTLPCSHSAD